MFYYATFMGLLAFTASGAVVKALNSPFHRHFKWAVFVYCAAALIAIAGFRAGIDRDYWNYEGSFTCFRHGYDDCRMEPAFALISYLAPEFEWVIFTYAFLSILPYLILIARSETPYLSLLVYFSTWFFLHEMTAIRIGLALAIALFALDYLQQRKYFKFLLICLIASAAHISCLALMVLVFMPKRHNVLVGMAAIGVCILLSLENYFEPIYGAIFSYLYGIDSRYALYGDLTAEMSRFGFLRTSLIVIYFICGLSARRIGKHVPKIHIYLNSMLIALCANYLFYFLPVAPSRLFDMFSMVLIFLLPATAFISRSIPIRFVAITMVLLFCIIRLAAMVEGGLVADYKSIL